MPDHIASPDVQPVDADIDPRVSPQRRELIRAPLGVLSVISVGGVLGALARHGLGVVFPHDVAGFPWATWAPRTAVSLSPRPSPLPGANIVEWR